MLFRHPCPLLFVSPISSSSHRPGLWLGSGGLDAPSHEPFSLSLPPVSPHSRRFVLPLPVTLPPPYPCSPPPWRPGSSLPPGGLPTSHLALPRPHPLPSAGCTQHPHPRSQHNTSTSADADAGAGCPLPTTTATKNSTQGAASACRRTIGWGCHPQHAATRPSHHRPLPHFVFRHSSCTQSLSHFACVSGHSTTRTRVPWRNGLFGLHTSTRARAEHAHSACAAPEETETEQQRSAHRPGGGGKRKGARSAKGGGREEPGPLRPSCEAGGVDDE